MSPMNANDHNLLIRFPRVSGDEPAASVMSAAVNWFSPRERG